MEREIKMNQTDHVDKAEQYFLEGYNCSQSVLSAFGDLTGFDLSVSARLASSLGAGMGRMREVCGAVTGALLVLGMVCGYEDPEDQEAKTDHYLLVQEFARRFREANGSIICRELLEGVKVRPGNIPEDRTEEYYAERPCLRYVSRAAAILDLMLEEKREDSERKR